MSDGVSLVVEATKRFGHVVFDLTELDSWVLDNGDDSVLRSEVVTLGQVQPVTRPQVSLDVLHFRVVGMRFGQCLRKCIICVLLVPECEWREFSSRQRASDKRRKSIRCKVMAAFSGPDKEGLDCRPPTRDCCTSRR